MTDLDKSLQLEAVYYGTPVPRSLGALTSLGFVFDRVHFPGVYLPRGDYDRAAWQAEIERIASHNLKDFDSQLLLAAMRFSTFAETLDGFCMFDRSREDGLDKHEGDGDLVQELYDALWGPPDGRFEPVFCPWHHKGVPDSREHLTYPGDYYYQAGAIRKAGELGVSLISDLPGIPIPGVGPNVTSDAKALSAFLAMQAMNVALPDLPVLRPDDLMEFRADNRAALRAFRRAMLRYAGEWRGQLRDLEPEQVAQETEFLVQSEIVPALDELRQQASDPARPWHKRAVDGIRVTVSIVASAVTLQKDKALGEILAAIAPMFFTELEAKGDKQHALRRSDLYYLLKIQNAGKRD